MYWKIWMCKNNGLLEDIPVNDFGDDEHEDEDERWDD